MNCRIGRILRLQDGTRASFEVCDPVAGHLFLNFFLSIEHVLSKRMPLGARSFYVPTLPQVSICHLEAADSTGGLGEIPLSRHSA